MNSCTNCHTTLHNHAAFCPECGIPVNRNLPNEFEYISKNKFTGFISPVLNEMDRGNFLVKPMQWLFIVIAVALLISPIGTVIELKKEDVFADASIFAIIISIFSLFMGWVGFQIWWQRKKTLEEKIEKNDEFKAIPLFSYYLQTMGEWYGAYVAIMGIGVTIATFFLTESTGYFIGLKLIKYFIILPPSIDFSSYSSIFYSVIGGFFILIFFRFIAEFVRAIAAIANNTSRNK